MTPDTRMILVYCLDIVRTGLGHGKDTLADTGTQRVTARESSQGFRDLIAPSLQPVNPMSLFIACILLYAHGFSWPWYAAAAAIYGVSFWIRQEHYSKALTHATMQSICQAMDSQNAAVMAAIRARDDGSLLLSVQKAEEVIRSSAELKEEVRLLRYKIKATY